jgi:hypothetical protein
VRLAQTPVRARAEKEMTDSQSREAVPARQRDTTKKHKERKQKKKYKKTPRRRKNEFFYK